MTKGVLKPPLTYANVMATIAVFIALGGTSYAVTQLPRNSVGDRQLKPNAVSGAKVRDASIGRADLAGDALVAGPRGARGPAGRDGQPGPQGVAGQPGPAGVVGGAEAWRPLPFATSWGNYGGENEIAVFRKDQLGRVNLRGTVTFAAGTPSAFSPIANLPDGYRPPRRLIFVVGAGEGATGQGLIAIKPDGVIHWVQGSTAEKDYTSLDGVNFWTD